MNERGALGRATAKGLIWLLFQTIGGRFVSLLSQLALAYLLLPSQFGVISLVYTITSVAGVMVNFGIDGVLLQRHKTFRLWVAPAFWVSFALGLAGLAVVLVLAPVFSFLYKSPELTLLASIIALSMPLGALSTVPYVKIRSNLDFRFLALYSTCENIASQLGVIVLAWNGFGALSFVLPTPIIALVKTIVFWWYAPTRLKGRPKKRQLGFLLSNGLSIFGSGLIAQVISQGDYAILGLISSHVQLGFYFFAFRISVQPLWMLAGNFTSVLFPALSQITAEPARQLKAALHSAELLSYAIMPGCFLQAALAGPFLHLFFGQRWSGAVPLVQLLSLGFPLDAAAWIAGTLMGARRDYRRRLICDAIMLPTFLAFVTIGALAGDALGAALAVALYYWITGPIYTLVAFRHYGASFDEVAALYVKPLLLAGVAIGVAYAGSCLPWIAGHELARLFEIGIVGPALYVALLWRVEPARLHEILERLGVFRLLGPMRRLALR